MSWACGEMGPLRWRWCLQTSPVVIRWKEDGGRVVSTLEAAFCLGPAPKLAGCGSGGRSNLGHSWVFQPFWQQSVWGLLFPHGGEVEGCVLPASPACDGTEGST